MLAGFRSALRQIAPDATFTCCVPFPRESLTQRFPEITWLPYDEDQRARAIRACDVWLGLGGSPFQSSLSRWFLDHLIAEAAACAREKKPMFFLGIGVQDTNDLASPEARAICAQAAAIWTRDTAAADVIRALPDAPRVEAATDLAHVFFREKSPPPAARGRATLVANFDYVRWAGQAACLAALESLPANDRVWLAQESRDLPGAERALFAALPAAAQARWKFISPDLPGAPLPATLARWPSGEWLVTARYHAAIAGAWAGSKIVVLTTNEKLRGAARELGLVAVDVDADQRAVTRALAAAAPVAAPQHHAARAFAACADFVRSAVAPGH